jgi:hypothetical protein
VELRFVSAALYELDKLESEVMACTVWQDVRPSDGVAGLCDGRLAGRISGLQRQGYLAGNLGEVMLVPGRPRLSFDKLLLFGAGPRADFNENVFSEIVEHMLRTIDDLHANQVVLELPGRQAELIAAERAADMLLAAAGRSREECVWLLVEDAEARRRITEHMIEERRRVRRDW